MVHHTDQVEAFRERLVTDPEDLPGEVRQRVFETARRISAERARPS